MINTNYADSHLYCPNCGSPEKREIDRETLHTYYGDNITVKTYSCTKCGKVWDQRSKDE